MLSGSIAPERLVCALVAVSGVSIKCARKYLLGHPLRKDAVRRADIAMTRIDTVLACSPTSGETVDPEKAFEVIEQMGSLLAEVMHKVQK